MCVSEESEVLSDDAVYRARDSLLCSACAGYTARTTGKTISGQSLRPVSARLVSAWPVDEFGPCSCDCGRLIAVVVAGRVVVSEPAAAAGGKAKNGRD